MLGQLLRGLTQPDLLSTPGVGEAGRWEELWDSRAPASLNFIPLTPGDREVGGSRTDRLGWQVAFTALLSAVIPCCHPLRWGGGGYGAGVVPGQYPSQLRRRVPRPGFTNSILYCIQWW
jgi:hypothetical protein